MSYNPFSLEGKTILVTGSTSGIGRATAVECSKMGAKVVVTGRNEERAKAKENNATAIAKTMFDLFFIISYSV